MYESLKGISSFLLAEMKTFFGSTFLAVCRPVFYFTIMKTPKSAIRTGNFTHHSVWSTAIIMVLLSLNAKGSDWSLQKGTGFVS